jgi:CBS domain-containing protein
MHSTTVREVMNQGIVACSQTASIAEVARVMTGCRVHCVAVVMAREGAAGHPTIIGGIVSDIDLLRWATSADTHGPISALARHPVVTIAPTPSVREAAETMADRGIDHLVVADRDQATPLGILSALDVAGVLASGEP